MKECVWWGLWNIASWIALRRACQIAQSLASILMKSSCGIDSSSEKMKHFALHRIITSTRSSSFNGQKQRAMLHSIKECRQESSEPQSPHSDCTAIFWCLRKSEVGKDCCASLHRKKLIFDGTSIFQIFFHAFISPSEYELSARPANYASQQSLVDTSMRYDERTKKHYFSHVPMTRNHRVV